jgi:peptidoglycan/xylan/chitin deacetylase (PgdA/CDA1 family)
MKSRSVSNRLKGAYARRMAKWLARRPFTMPRIAPIISFTFDDFPRSALEAGGGILEESGALGTYFVSLGLQGQSGPTGEIFHQEDLAHLLARGHELGCHTFHHRPAWETTPSVYVASVTDNARAFTAIDHARALETHSYPISYPRPGTKRRLAPRFRGCRGGGQTFNHGTVDLNYLSSFFLEQSRDDFGAVERIIWANADAGGWLIFSTHDIALNPTRFGCTPAFFEQVVQTSAKSGARILTVTAALDAIGVH